MQFEQGEATVALREGGWSVKGHFYLDVTNDVDEEGASLQ